MKNPISLAAASKSTSPLHIKACKSCSSKDSARFRVSNTTGPCSPASSHGGNRLAATGANCNQQTSIRMEAPSASSPGRKRGKEAKQTRNGYHIPGQQARKRRKKKGVAIMSVDSAHGSDRDNQKIQTLAAGRRPTSRTGGSIDQQKVLFPTFMRVLIFQYTTRALTPDRVRCYKTYLND